jgi:hypothetical protein
VILVIGPGPLPAATRIELGYFAPMRCSPRRDSQLSVSSDCLTALTTAIQEGDQAGAMQALPRPRTRFCAKRGGQLSADPRAVMSEVLITADGVAGSAVEIFATLLQRSRPCRRVRARDQGHQPAGAIPRCAVSSDRRGARPRGAPRRTLRLVGDGAGAWDDRAVSRDAPRAHRGSWGSSRPFDGARRRAGSPARGDAHVRLRPPRPACPSSKHPRGDLHPLQSARCPPLQLRDQAWTLASGEAERFPERSEDSNFRRFGSVELRRPVQ